MSVLRFAAAACCLVALSASAKCTFDFSAASARLHGGDGAGANLLEGVTWSHGARMSTYDIRRDDPRWQAVVKLARKSASDGEYVAENPPELLKALGNDERLAGIAVSEWKASLNLPDAEGGRYRLSFLYAMSHTLGKEGMAFVVFYANGKQVKSERFGLANIDSGEFSFSRVLSVPKGADRVFICNRIDSIGKLRFWNPSLTKLPSERPIVLQQAATGWFDSRFEISEGQPGFVCWHWKRGFGTPESALKDFRAVLTVPKGFALEGLNFADLAKVRDVKTLEDGSKEYCLSCDYWLRPKESLSPWHRIGAILTSPGTVGTAGTLRFRAVAADGTPLSDEAVTELAVVKRVEAPRPKRFLCGVTLGGTYWRSADARGTELMAKMLADTGHAGVLVHGTTPEISATFRKAGLREVLQGSSTLANGFCIGPEKGRPENEKYVFSPKGHKFATRSACPLSVSGESEFFRTVTVPWLKQQTEGSGADGLWTNWEPYSYAGRGCMCDRCRAAFAKYVGVSDAEMANDWPKELAFGGKWHDRIARFRSIEHGKLVKTLSKHANVIFGIFWGEMSSAWRPRNLASEVQAFDYADAVKTMCPWGPYPHWSTEGAYAFQDACCLETFCAAKDVREQVNRDYRPPHRPRIMGFPSGCSFGCDWVGQPEWLFLQQLSFFLNGWESSYMEGFPRGYDARYWKAMALVNRIAAKYEDYVYDGRRTDAKVRLVPRKPFRTKRNVSDYLDWTRGEMPVVQAVAYERGGKVMIAVVNFSEEEPAAFDLLYDGKVVERGVTVRAPGVVIREFGT